MCRKTSCRNGPRLQVVCRYVTQEIRSTVNDDSVAVRPRVQCGTSAGHMSPGSEPEALEQAADAMKERASAPVFTA